MTFSKEIRQAEKFDQLGQHQQAINCLVQAVHKNDVEGLTRLGKRLLIGDRAPHYPKEAFSLLLEASHRGGAEAPAILSVLLALGTHGPKDWQRALQYLALSAQRGWQSSQDLLKLLAGDLLHEEKTESADPGFWMRISQAMDTKALQQVPEAQVLSHSPLICSHQHFASQPYCQWLMHKAASKLQRAQVYDAVEKRTITHSTRTNRSASFNLLETDLLCVLLQARMANAIGLPLNHFETMTILHYSPGEEIREHYDFIDPKAPDYTQQIDQQGQRVVTFLLYLNNEYQDGNTSFPVLGLSHRGREGEGLYFVNCLPDQSPDLRTRHAGCPPSQGEKWVVSQFVRARPLL